MAMSDGPILEQVNLVVSDMEVTVDFYRRLGLTIDEMPQEWNAHHRRASMPGGLELEFDSPQSVASWDQGWPPGQRASVIGFTVATREAVDEIYARLTDAGAKAQQPPIDAFWGSRYAVVEDPDGNAVGIMSPPETEHQSPGPSF
jgi:predicted lactoylglutathione lyase